jgi:hypothetical protein
MAAIPTPWEVEIRKTGVQGQPRQKVAKPLLISKLDFGGSCL